MDFTPDPDHVAIAEAVDNVCSQFDDTYWSKCDTEHRFPWEFYDQMAKGGWVGILIPEEYGGGGRGIMDGTIVLNRIAASGAGSSADRMASDQSRKGPRSSCGTSSRLPIRSVSNCS